LFDCRPRGLLTTGVSTHLAKAQIDVEFVDIVVVGGADWWTVRRGFVAPHGSSLDAQNGAEHTTYGRRITWTRSNSPNASLRDL
jgi:hypothetical protein